MNRYNYQQRIALRKGYRRHAYNHGATHTITLNFNRHKISAEAARLLIKKWHRLVDRKLYGKRFNGLPPEQRTSFIAFIEHMNSNLHYHAVLKTPDVEGFDRLAAGFWKQIVPSGSLHFHEEKFGRRRLARWCCYITKHLMQGNNEEYIIDSSSFQPTTKV